MYVEILDRIQLCFTYEHTVFLHDLSIHWTFQEYTSYINEDIIVLQFGKLLRVLAILENCVTEGKAVLDIWVQYSGPALGPNFVAFKSIMILYVDTHPLMALLGLLV